MVCSHPKKSTEHTIENLRLADIQSLSRNVGTSKHSKVTEMTSETAYLRPPEFARLTGISESRLSKLRMSGGGPAFAKIGRSVRYDRAAGLAWMAAYTCNSTSEAQVNKLNKKRERAARHDFANPKRFSP